MWAEQLTRSSKFKWLSRLPTSPFTLLDSVAKKESVNRIDEFLSYRLMT